MSELKHTPSPWTVDYDDNWYICAAPGTSALTSHPADSAVVGVLERDDATSREDAYLIAAAPELYQSLADILSRFEDLLGPGKVNTRNGELGGDAHAIAQAHAAIAKALGE